MTHVLKNCMTSICVYCSKSDVTSEYKHHMFKAKTWHQATLATQVSVTGISVCIRYTEVTDTRVSMCIRYTEESDTYNLEMLLLLGS